MFVDSHCHLAFPEFDDRIAEVRAEMARARVTRALVICTTVEEFPRVHALALAHDNFWASAGVHPDSEGGAEPSVEQLVELALRPRVVAVGETGLDYYRIGDRTHDDMAWQRERFRRHLRAARLANRPLIVHTRAAADDTLTLMREEGAERAGGVFHCFTETLDVARRALELGFLISFSGILSFRNAEALRDVARYVPLDRCLIETDSPYLAPVPHRGRPNQPAWVADVAQALADAKQLPLETVAEVTSRNFDQLFHPANPIEGMQ
jgi:TatD DNase family protein